MLRFILISLILIIPVAIYLYFYIRRAVCFYSRQERKRWITVLSAITAAALAVLSMNIFSTGAMVILHLAVISLCMELLNLILNKTAGKKRKLKRWTCIYRCGLIPVIITAVILGYGYFHMNDVRKKEYTISTEKKLRSQGYKIALITDLHFGTTMDKEKLREHCAEISKEKPDIVLLGGDIVDDRTSKSEMEEAFETLSAVSNELGIYYVYGNHDRAFYTSSPAFTAEELRDTITGQGITILEDNTAAVGDDIILTGRQDRGYSAGGGRKSTEELLRGADKSKFLLLLDHQPSELKENAQAGVDLQLSGHTHGGQIWPVGLIIDLLGFGELNYGYEQIGSGQFIVSSGIAGWGYPIRTGAQSEYVIVNLR